MDQGELIKAEAEEEVILTTTTNPQANPEEIIIDQELVAKKPSLETAGTKESTNKAKQDQNKPHNNEIPTSGETKQVLTQFLEEDRESGSVSLKVLNNTIKACGGYFGFITAFTFCFLANTSDYAVQYFILQWTKQYNIDPERSIKTLWTTTITLQVRNILCGLRAITVFLLVLRASRSIHASMSFRILHAKISEFLDRVPKGQILNRFSKDIAKIDTDFKWYYSDILLSGTLAINSLMVIIWATGGYSLLIPLLFFMIIAILYQRRYMMLKREITRLQAVTNSPVLGWSSAVLKSCCEVRALNKYDYVKNRLKYLINENMKNSLLVFGLNSWFKTRITMCNLWLVQVPGYALMLYQIWVSSASVDVQKLILFIIASTRLIDTMSVFLNEISNFETSLISFERCQAFGDIEPEEGYLNFKREEELFTLPTKDKIPEIMHIGVKKGQDGALFPNGEVQFVDLFARYPTSSNSVLKDLNLKIKPGEKIGIVGRTGAGKTSFIKLIWRCLQIEAGKLLIDDVDINKIDLKALRSEVMVISQETCLFQGTLRENIAPKLQHIKETDPQGYKSGRYTTQEGVILKKLGNLGFPTEKLAQKGLDFDIEVNGNNLSQGEKQIICFIRAIVDKKKVVILDEATAGVDMKTEQLIQRMVDTELDGSTMFVIAHRVQTVLGCDKILVLEAGRVKEFDEPGVLAKDETSDFYHILGRYTDALEQ